MAMKQTEYQVYGIAKGGGCTHAGVHTVTRMGPRVARWLQRDWEAWRDAFLADNPGDYPLREDALDPDRTTVCLAVHPVGQPERTRHYSVGRR